MPLSFPTSSVAGATYQSGSSATYQYDGAKWIVVTPPTQIFVTAATASLAVTASNALTVRSSNSSSFALYALETTQYTGARQNLILNNFQILSSSGITFTVPSGFTSTKVVFNSTIWGEVNATTAAAGRIRARYSGSGIGVPGEFMDGWTTLATQVAGSFNMSNIHVPSLSPGTYTVYLQAQREDAVGTITDVGVWVSSTKVEVFVKL